MATTETRPVMTGGTSPCLALAYAVAALQRDEKWGQPPGNGGTNMSTNSSSMSSSNHMFVPTTLLANATLLATYQPSYMIVPGAMMRTTTTTTHGGNDNAALGAVNSNSAAVIHASLPYEIHHQQQQQQQQQERNSATPESMLLYESTRHCHNDQAEEGDEIDLEDGVDGEQRLARSRERNREHARRTRLRKKAHMEALHSKICRLESERQRLRQKIEECSIASILLGLSHGADENSATEVASSSPLLVTNNTTPESARVALLAAGGKRKRFLIESITVPFGQRQQKKDSPSPSALSTAAQGGKSHINWKTGVYVDDQGTQKHLTQDQLENLRRERNRMHAKMTRDRRKCFISTMEIAVADLESDINHMKSILEQSQSGMVTPVLSPMVKPDEWPMLEHEDGETTVVEMTRPFHADDDEHDGSSGEASNETFMLTAAV